MLRITTITATDSSTTLKLEGKISSEWVALLDRECRNVMSRKLPVVLDMTSVTYMDGNGVALLRSLSRHQVTFIHRSRFIQELLDKGDQS
jgi:anti-anti-sigma regulatory factor